MAGDVLVQAHQAIVQGQDECLKRPHYSGVVHLLHDRADHHVQLDCQIDALRDTDAAVVVVAEVEGIIARVTVSSQPRQSLLGRLCFKSGGGSSTENVALRPEDGVGRGFDIVFGVFDLGGGGSRTRERRTDWWRNGVLELR